MVFHTSNLTSLWFTIADTRSYLPIGVLKCLANEMV